MGRVQDRNAIKAEESASKKLWYLNFKYLSRKNDLNRLYEV